MGTAEPEAGCWFLQVLLAEEVPGRGSDGDPHGVHLVLESQQAVGNALLVARQPHPDPLNVAAGRERKVRGQSHGGGWTGAGRKGEQGGDLGDLWGERVPIREAQGEPERIFLRWPIINKVRKTIDAPTLPVFLSNQTFSIIYEVGALFTPLIANLGTEAQRGAVTFPRSHSSLVKELGINQR